VHGVGRHRGVARLAALRDRRLHHRAITIELAEAAGADIRTRPTVEGDEQVAVRESGEVVSPPDDPARSLERGVDRRRARRRESKSQLVLARQPLASNRLSALTRRSMWCGIPSVVPVATRPTTWPYVTEALSISSTSSTSATVESIPPAQT
jgi:hypothetical protein